MDKNPNVTLIGNTIKLVALESIHLEELLETLKIGDIDRLNQNAEIGWTWLSPAYWRTGANTECKFLLLQYCFEQLTLVRVQFSVSGNNTRSQRALERIGAIREGVFRKHRRDTEGRFHDNVFYSITDSDWPEIKSTLEHMIHIKYE